MAVAAAPGPLVVWRWSDALVVEDDGDGVLLREPAHGEVRARLRDAAQRPATGTRVSASAGLPGAAWWAAGPAGPVEQADVEREEVAAFYAEHGLWDRLA